MTLGSSSIEQINTTATGNITLSGGVAESAAGKSLTKAGEGTLSIGGSSTYSGITKISAGTLAVSAPAALASGSTLNSGGSTGDTTTLQLTSPSASYAMSVLSVGGIMRFTSPGGASSITFTSASGHAQTGSSGKQLEADANTSVVVTGSFDLIGSTAAADRSLLVKGDGNFTFNGVIQNNASGTASAFVGGFTKNGNGTANLNNAANTYSGPTTINGGTLNAITFANAGSPSSLGNVTLTDASGLIINGGTLRHDAANVASTNRKFSAGISGATLDSSAASASNTLSFSSSGTMNTPSTGTRTVTLTGSNTGSNTLSLILPDDSPATPTSISKTGLGTWVLNGLNTYTGDTIVDGGILAVNGTAIADTNKLIINGGKVAATGTEVVNTLFFGATPQGSGTWGASGSGATNIDNTHFSGTAGVVSVTTSGVVGYNSWKGLNAGGQAANLDYDYDSVLNGVEYFMNSAPGFTANPAVVGGQVSWPNGGNIPSSAYGTQFVVQTSPDLVIWTNVLISDTNLSNLTGSVTYTLPTGPQKSFVRLSVTPI